MTDQINFLAGLVPTYAADQRVGLATRRFLNNVLSCPLFQATVARVRILDQIFFLNNWWGDEKDPIGTLEEGCEHVEAIIRAPNPRLDQSLTHLVHTNPWSPDGFTRKFPSAAAANAILGIVQGPNVGYLKAPLYRWAFKTLWIPFLREFPYQEINLCGGWSKFVVKMMRAEFGHRVIRRNHPSRQFQWEKARTD